MTEHSRAPNHDLSLAQADGQARESSEERQARILRARSTRLAARGASNAHQASDRFEVLVFALAGTHYALRTRFVVRASPPQKTTIVPNTPNEILGVTNLNGEICPVVDLGRILGSKPRDPRKPSNILFLKRATRPIGVSVDAFVATRLLSDVEVAVPASAGPSAREAIVAGITRDGVVLLDAERLAAIAPG